MSKKHLTETRFDSFSLPENVLQGLQEAGFEYCTPIQEATLPHILNGEDIAGQAQTGTGKTLAFLVATLQLLAERPAAENRKINQPRVMILAPTRELAIQIGKDAEVVTKHTEHKVAVVYGGTGYEKQRNQIEQDGVDILIGTPGRLIDYFKQHVFDLRALQVLVMDEADRMFDLGFIKDIRYLLRRCPQPADRTSMLFSATLSYRVLELAYEHMNNPTKVTIESEQVTAKAIREVGYMVANDEKVNLLIGLMRKVGEARSIVFVNTKRQAENVWGFLEGNGFKSAILSGDVPQKKRERLLQEFAANELSVLVATDVAARGLHIEGVSHVYNYDLPDDREDYVHRIGRTARAGAEGDAISFVCETYAFSLPDIEDYIGHKIPMEPVTGELIAEIDPGSKVKMERKPRPPRNNNRSGGKGGNGQKRRHHNKPRGDKPAA